MRFFVLNWLRQTDQPDPLIHYLTSYTCLYVEACLNVDSLPPYAANLPLGRRSTSSASSQMLSSSHRGVIIIVIFIVLFPRHHHCPKSIPLPLWNLYISLCDLNFTSVSTIIFPFSSSKCAVEVPM
jgi:hypothetical protein